MPNPRTVKELPWYLRVCSTCEKILTDSDLRANADDAIELTDGLGCRECLDKASRDAGGEIAEARLLSEHYHESMGDPDAH